METNTQPPQQGEKNTSTLPGVGRKWGIPKDLQRRKLFQLNTQVVKLYYSFKRVDLPTAAESGHAEALCRALWLQFKVLRDVTATNSGFFIWNVPNQVWQCGGSVEVLPCARIAHIERAHKPYTEDLTSHMRRNALRVAEVWMDEFKSHVYMAWNIPMEVSVHSLVI